MAVISSFDEMYADVVKFVHILFRINDVSTVQYSGLASSWALFL